MRSEWPYALLPEDAYDDEVVVRLEDAYHAADEESVAAARTYRATLRALAAASTVVALAFLVYDAFGSFGGLALCGLTLALEAVLARRATRLDCHMRFIGRRVLAEALRVQEYLHYAGSPLLVGDLLTWTQLEETGWVRGEVDALVVGAAPSEPHDIRACWVEGQLEYHRKASERTVGEVERSGRVVTVALWSSIALYAALIVLEIAWGATPVADPLRMGLKVLLGSVSAATVFIANYYDKAALARVTADHQKMERFFSWMAARLDEEGQTPELLERLAREELVENGNWYSYQLECTLDITL